MDHPIGNNNTMHRLLSADRLNIYKLFHERNRGDTRYTTILNQKRDLKKWQKMSILHLLLSSSYPLSLSVSLCSISLICFIVRRTQDLSLSPLLSRNRGHRRVIEHRHLVRSRERRLPHGSRERRLSLGSVFFAYFLILHHCCQPLPSDNSLPMISSNEILNSMTLQVLVPSSYKGFGKLNVLQFFLTAEESMDHYNQKRCVDGKGLVLPSACLGDFGFTGALTGSGQRTVSDHSSVLFSTKKHPRTKDLLLEDFWFSALKKGVMVFALPGEPGLTELAGDFKIHFHDRQGDFYCWLNTTMKKIEKY
ncbi:hypothetical protein Ahy_A08g039615 isoform C [Arachis hypogaea]|uniref:PTEN2A/B C2 domain-containing protein n=1 Tax=Arachis hypogaea TaxID=3818 RepID=A0A445BWS6_ARAHY|nr:hypothetical protein Ahy_A08g039615 isoform C [Arachis hypogaea]